jgi:hypothetical protein
MSTPNKQREVTFLTEQVDDGKLKRTIKVFESNSGRYVAEYTVGTVRWQLPVSGRTAIEAMRAAKKWLARSTRSR